MNVNHLAVISSKNVPGQCSDRFPDLHACCMDITGFIDAILNYEYNLAVIYVKAVYTKCCKSEDALYPTVN